MLNLKLSKHWKIEFVKANFISLKYDLILANFVIKMKIKFEKG